MSSQIASLTHSWDENKTKITDRCQSLSEAVKHRQAFYDQMERFEKWMGKMERKLDSSSEIYADEIPDRENKLKDLERECIQKQPSLEQISSEVERLCSLCSPEEKQALSENYNKIKTQYQNMMDLIESREQLCQTWSQYSAVQKEANSKIKMLNQKLASKDLSHDEIADILAELENVHGVVTEWNNKKPELDEMMKNAEMKVKDRPSQRTLFFATEIETLESSVTKATMMVEQKQGHLDEVTEMWTAFEEQKLALLHELRDIDQQATAATVTESSYDGVRGLDASLQVHLNHTLFHLL